MTIGYDSIDVNKGLLLDLPFDEGTGVLVHDLAKPQRVLTQHDPGGGSFNWGNLITGCPYLEFVTVGFGGADGVYLDCPAADTLDLNFTSGDYSIGAWVNHADTGHFKPKIVIGRYGVDLDGWEIYLETDIGPPAIYYLEQRHHHAPDRSGCYSTSWIAASGWSFLGISRSGLYPQHYRNGLPLEMSYAAGGVLDPTTCNRDLVIGVRYTKNQDWYKGKQLKMRIWERALAEEEWRFLYNCEKHWFN